MNISLKYLYGSIVTFSLSMIACGKNSAGRNQFNLVSDDEMNEMGDQAYADIINKAQLSQNQRINTEVRSIGENIAVASGESFDWQFNIIAEDTVNAFCLPGGKVAVYTGILPVAQNSAALAAVMGHEVAHATLRHSSERMSQDLLLQTGLSLLSITFANSQYQSIIAAAMGIGSTYGVTLPFSRYHESEADRVGLEYMAKAGYDPREAIGLWERMGALSESRPPEFLSTHPDPASRAKDLQSHMANAISLYENSKQQPTFNLN
ncbi:MAG: M48 family peptidase [Proteobacteria bacterium]|nr:MAG: M48 family peptidase [Pseudomonadota bacterium]